MTLFDQFAAAVLLVIVTLCLQCAVVGVLINWLRRFMTRHMYELGPIRSAALVLKLTIAIILLQGVVILLWASFYRLRCFPSWELSFYFSGASYSTVGYGDVVLPAHWRPLRTSGEHDGGIDVWSISQPPRRGSKPTRGGPLLQK